MTDDRDLPEGRSQQSPYIPLPAYYLQDEQDDQIDLADYIRVLWRRRYLILLGTLLCALTAFVVTVMMPPVYQARTTLILQPAQFSIELKPEPLSVETLKMMFESDFISGSGLLILQPPEVSGELKPEPLSVETLQSMLESDYIASKLRNKLLEKNVIQPDTPIEQIKDMLLVEIPAGKGPLIDLVVEADSPEKAEIVANTWAEIFLVENASLTKSVQQANLELINSIYLVVKNTLMDLQSQLKETQEHYVQALLRLDKSWSSRIVDFRKETERSQKEHQKETERLRLEFTNRWKLDLLKEELKIKEDKLIELEDQSLETEVAIERESIRKAIDELRGLVTQKEIELFGLLKDRELELSNLMVDGQAELEILKKTQNSEMTLLEGERDFAVNELNREIYVAQRTYEPVVAKHRSIELAKVQEEPDVKIGALAVAPGLPIGRKGTSLNTLMALLVGFMMSVMLVFVLEYAQSISLFESSEGRVQASPSGTPGLELESPSATHRKLAGR